MLETSWQYMCHCRCPRRNREPRAADSPKEKGSRPLTDIRIGTEHDRGASYLRPLARRTLSAIASHVLLAAGSFTRTTIASTSTNCTIHLLSGWLFRASAGIGMGTSARISFGRRRGRAGDLSDVVMRPTPNLSRPVPWRGFDSGIIFDGFAIVELDGAEFLAVARVG